MENWVLNLDDVIILQSDRWHPHKKVDLIPLYPEYHHSSIPTPHGIRLQQSLGWGVKNIYFGNFGIGGKYVDRVC